MLLDRSLSALLSCLSSCCVPLASAPVFGPRKIPPLQMRGWGKLQLFAGSGCVSPATPREDVEGTRPSGVHPGLAHRHGISEYWPFSCQGLAFGLQKGV